MLRRHHYADTVVRFSAFIGTTPEFWLNIQNQFDLDELKASGKTVQFSSIKPVDRMQG
jgi:plasmid maintenance system antidote protein VapI